MFKTRPQFRRHDDYARYVKEHIVAGMIVRCNEHYGDIMRGDVGKVLRVSDGGGREGGEGQEGRGEGSGELEEGR